MKFSERLSPDAVIVAVLFIAAVLSVIFVGSLVAPPKTLLGRSMTAILPSLFPNLILSMLALFCAVFLFRWFTSPPPDQLLGFSAQGWPGGVAFFAVLTFYALVMKPFGFFLSTAVTLAVLSWLVGNRTIWQIILISLLAPVVLYLIATRLLAVSLPELSTIEFFYARLLR